jgi:integrase
MPKSQILIAIGGKLDNTNEDLENINNKLTCENTKYIQLIKNFTEEANHILISLSSDTDSLSKISEMGLNEETIKEYKGEWKIYSAWCFKNHHNALVQATTNKYLAQLKHQVSTIKNKRNRLQSILRHLSGQNVILTRIRRRVKMNQKYKMSHEEIEEYLKEQKSVNHEDYIIQFIMATYGCRVNACSGLRLNNLDFLEDGNKMFLPDSKTGTREVDVDKHLMKLLGDHVNKLTDGNSFVFEAGLSKNLRRRANVLCCRINRRIRESTVIRKSENFKYSSHMFRHSKAFQIYRECLEKGKEAARLAIGHQPGTSSINYYLF